MAQQASVAEQLCEFMDDEVHNVHCDVYLSDSNKQCPALAAEAALHSYYKLQLGLDYLNLTGAFCPASAMDRQELRTSETLYSVWHTFWTILPILYWFTIARLLTQSWPRLSHTQSTRRFVLEFVVITLPTVLSVNVANAYVEYFVLVTSLCFLFVVWWGKCLKRARALAKFDLGKRTRLMTLVRATIGFLTALCILAIDFESFPKDFRKSRRFGAGLMDTGIGLFVYSMGVVSRRPRRAADLLRLLRLVTPVLLLGLARTLVIMAIDYHQDEHEYGLHLNAFFTLGLTKLAGALISAVANKDSQLFALGLGTLILHEIVLQSGLSEFVMDPHLVRNTFWKANREGICSLPGFVGIYILSMFVGQWLQRKTSLSYEELMRRIQIMSLSSLLIWVTVVASIFGVGIARVTCNIGYASWILGIAVTMTTLFLFVFDLVLPTLWPVHTSATSLESGEEGAKLLNSSEENLNNKPLYLPTLVEAVNQNGLLFFLVANILTGGVNIFLKPENRTHFESVLILSLYMLLGTGFVYILYRLKIKIA